MGQPVTTGGGAAPKLRKAETDPCRYAETHHRTPGRPNRPCFSNEGRSLSMVIGSQESPARGFSCFWVCPGRPGSLPNGEHHVSRPKGLSGFGSQATLRHRRETLVVARRYAYRQVWSSSNCKLNCRSCAPSRKP